MRDNCPRLGNRGIAKNAVWPQISTLRSGSAQDFSLLMLLLFVGGVALWLAYGWLIAAWPVVIANAITLALASFILVMKLRFR